MSTILPRHLAHYASALDEALQMPTIIYLTTKFEKLLDQDDLPILSEVLESLGPSKAMSLVLKSPGGDVDAVRRMLTLLRRYTEVLNVIVVRQAVSASALFCLGADNIAMTPLANLSPIDPNLQKSSVVSTDTLPVLISSEDIRSFFEMSEKWLSINSSSNKVELLALLCQHIFPTTVSKLFRAEKYLLGYVSNLLRIQMPEKSDDDREAVATKLIRGYPTHSFALEKEDLDALGLKVRTTDPRESELLFKLEEACNSFCESQISEYSRTSGLHRCFLFTSQLVAGCISPYIELDSDEGLGSTKEIPSGWKVIWKA